MKGMKEMKGNLMKGVAMAVTGGLLGVVPVTEADGLGSAKCEQWRGHAAYVGWKGQELETVLRIVYRETGGTCRAGLHNGRGADDSYGLTQINTKGYLWDGHQGVKELCGRFVKKKGDLMKPLVNLWCAKVMERKYGMWVLWRVGGAA